MTAPLNPHDANIHLIEFISALPDWVRDVAWAPSTAMPFNIVASCSEDCCVYIWKQTEVRHFQHYCTRIPQRYIFYAI